MEEFAFRLAVLGTDEAERTLLGTRQRQSLFPAGYLVTNLRQHKYMQVYFEQRQAKHNAGARELGVRVANGFDASSAEDQGHNGREIVAMCKLGLSPLEAIRAATTTASELIGWQDKVGSIEPGKFADIVAVAGDPLLDISQVEHVKFVMKGGVVIKNEMSIAAPH